MVRKLKNQKKTQSPVEGHSPEVAMARMLDTVEPYIRPVTIALVLLLLIVGGIFTVTKMQEQTQAKQYMALSDALTEMREEDKAEPVKNLVQQQESSLTNGIAALALANKYYEDEDYDKAIAVFKTCIKKHSTVLPIGVPARIGYAYALEQKGQLQEAKQAFLDAAEAAELTARVAEAKAGAARCAESNGNTEQARQLYEEMLTLDYEGLYKDKADRALKRLTMQG